ncbi:MAG: hypothetical protein JW990_07825 [Thermoleophilia bacterium]|nr:hypothetical protein [Thermoleophilia bacterium]
MPLGAARSTARPRRKIKWNALIAAVVVVAVIAAIAIPLTRGGDNPPAQNEAGGLSPALQAQIEEMTGEEMIVDRAEAYASNQGNTQDLQARAFIEGAMQMLEGIISRLDSQGEYPPSEYRTPMRAALRSNEGRPLQWIWGTPGVYALPHADALMENNTVTWSFTPPSAYELATWSMSGAVIGVRVDRQAGSIVFYKNGERWY